MVLLGMSWLQNLWFEAEFSAQEEDTNSIVLEETKPSGCGLTARVFLFELARPRVTDRRGMVGVQGAEGRFPIHLGII
jgi:hypothetical protein